MARKLLCMVALISLVLLGQVAPGWADVYNLSNLGDLSAPNWAEGRDGDHVGSAPGSFHSYSNTNPQGQDWNIPSLTIDESKTVYMDQGDGWVIVKTVYNTLSQNVPSETPLFSAHLDDGTVINSSDTVITLIAKYQKDPGSIYPLYDRSSYMIYSEPGQPTTLTMEGSGSNGGTQFTLNATLVEMNTDHTHYGYISNFSVTYPAASPTPIPGAVWLFGTGLLGLACVRRRLRS
jgi:hypothetical protein